MLMKAETLAKYEQGKELFDNGMSIKSICSELKMAHYPFSKWLKENGVSVHSNNDGCEERFKRGMQLYLDGMSLTQASKEVGSSPKRLSKYLKNNGIEITNPIKVRQMNEDFFKVIDTEQKAYWLGFIYADGCVSENIKNGRVKSMTLGIILKDSDEGHLQKFLDDMGYVNGKVTHKNVALHGTSFKAARVAINNTQMCRDLIKLGATPRKSHTLTFPSKDAVPDHLLRHFIRGYVDGDGYVGHVTNSSRLRFGMVGTRWFLEGLMERVPLFKATIKIDKRSKIHTTNNSIDLTHTKAENIIRYLYTDANVYLDRKYNKILPFIENVE